MVFSLLLLDLCVPEGVLRMCAEGEVIILVLRRSLHHLSSPEQNCYSHFPFWIFSGGGFEMLLVYFADTTKRSETTCNSSDRIRW